MNHQAGASTAPAFLFSDTVKNRRRRNAATVIQGALKKEGICRKSKRVLLVLLPLLEIFGEFYPIHPDLTTENVEIVIKQTVLIAERLTMPDRI